MRKPRIKFLLFLIATGIGLVNNTFAQPSIDSTKNPVHFGGTLTATQNGISLIPSFSLGKPALMFDLNAGGKRLSFEPFFRFSMAGKPWAFIFWWRYKLVEQKKFRLGVGAHPSYVFRNIKDNNGTASIQASRYAAAEIAPNYLFAKNISAGFYYLYSHGLDKTSVQNTHFVTANLNFLHVGISRLFYLKFNPQLYYLWQDNKNGFYATYTLTLLSPKSPFAIQTIMNKAIRSDIPAKNFVWNASLLYNFNHYYWPKKTG
jgi:hypothetical protein